ncbi:serine/threonine protein kinase [Sinosporangium siamense]|uniref:non-specific serine/threonine protein kinase n=1 Tax=Sinosporangium siamense TaxID=1367973 RepID=A0A919RBY1_9ACTN|nr:serine/threonine-protein kinase [Sinosporangium siamense]GII90848.1 hypothetical protein Ssi02_10790 [Sinosporangium siamense]
MSTSAPLRSGDPARLGEYDLRGRLGEGGQGVVYLAVDSAGNEVAIKWLRPDLSGDDIMVERFVREVAVAKRVAPFCTAQVIGTGVEDERPYIISEYVHGRSLQAVVVTQGVRAGAALHRLAIGTATALAAIHQAGIVHRDFKPANVLLAHDGPRVIDFGIARALDATSTLTSSMPVGTPAYMAPEQILGQPVSPVTDMFSWASTMVFAASGAAPFGSDTLPAVINRVLNTEPDLSVLPGPLRDIVGSCMEKDAANRPTAEQVILRLIQHPVAMPADLRDAATAAATALPPAPPAALPPAAPSGTLLDPESPDQTPPEEGSHSKEAPGDVAGHPTPVDHKPADGSAPAGHAPAEQAPPEHPPLGPGHGGYPPPPKPGTAVQPHGWNPPPPGWGPGGHPRQPHAAPHPAAPPAAGAPGQHHPVPHPLPPHTPSPHAFSPPPLPPHTPSSHAPSPHAPSPQNPSPHAPSPQNPSPQNPAAGSHARRPHPSQPPPQGRPPQGQSWSAPSQPPPNPPVPGNPPAQAQWNNPGGPQANRQPQQQPSPWAAPSATPPRVQRTAIHAGGIRAPGSRTGMFLAALSGAAAVIVLLVAAVLIMGNTGGKGNTTARTTKTPTPSPTTTHPVPVTGLTVTELPDGRGRLFEHPDDAIRLTSYEIRDKAKNDWIDYARASATLTGKFQLYPNNWESRVSPNGRYLASRGKRYSEDNYDTLTITDRTTNTDKVVKTVKRPMIASVRDWSRDSNRVLLAVARSNGLAAGYVIVDVKTGKATVSDKTFNDTKGSLYSFDERGTGAVIQTTNGSERGLRFLSDVAPSRPDLRIGVLPSDTLNIFSPAGTRFTSSCPGASNQEHCIWATDGGKELTRFSSECDKVLGWYNEDHLFCWDSGQPKVDRVEVVNFRGEFVRTLLETPKTTEFSPAFTATPPR